MRMKKDHMRNGQLKPAYNNLARPDSGGPSKRLRLHHMRKCIPPSKWYVHPKTILKKLQKTYPNKLDNIIADVGYESEENYVYLAERNLTSYINPSNYEKSKTRKYKKNKVLRKA